MSQEEGMQETERNQKNDPGGSFLMSKKKGSKGMAKGMREQPLERMRTASEMDGMPGREVSEKRTRGGKVYDLGGGQYQAVLFSEPVHYRNAKGEWKEIDNKLKKKAGEEEALSSGEGEVIVTLRRTDKEQMVSLERGEKSLSWRIRDAAAAAPKSIPCTHRGLGERRSVLKRVESDARYENVFPGVDVRCHLSGDSFKEDIVFANREAVREVSFDIIMSGVTLTKDETGRIEARDESGAAVFTLPAPFMVDSSGKEERGEVEVRLLAGENGKAQLLYRPEAEWAESAAYPVTLDPVVVYSDKEQQAIETTFVSTYEPNKNQGTSMSSCPIWSNSDCTTGKMMYIRFKQSNLPAIDSSYYVTKASMRITISSVPTRTTNLFLREPLGNWEVNTLTYNNQPSLNRYPIDYANLKTKHKVGAGYTYDISNLVRKWYTGQNYGMKLEFSELSRVDVYANGSSSKKPYAVINYVSLAGLEGYLNYETQAVGRAGTGYVGLYNGNLVFEHEDTRMNGSLTPVSVSHWYNSCYHNVTEYNAGRGWKLSTQQTLHLEQLKDAAGTLINYYVYTDGDGTRHHFKNESGWKDLSGLGLTLTVSGSTAEIRDKGDNTMVFDLPTVVFGNNYGNVKYLKSAKNAMGVAVTYPIGSGNIVDGAGRVTQLSYSGMLSSVYAPYMNQAVSYSYSGANLSVIAHEDGKQSSYQYDGSGLLVCARNHDGQSVRYSYTAQEPFRVTQVIRCLTDTSFNVTRYISGRGYRYENCLTVVTDLTGNEYGTGLNEGKKLYYHFNDYGNAVSVNDELGYAMFSEYSDGNPVNHPSTVSRLQRSVPNLLKNHNFLDANSTVWIAEQEGTGTCGYSSENNLIGGRAYKLNKPSATGEIRTYQHIFGLEAGKSYTFSTHYKTTGSTSIQLRAIIWKEGYTNQLYQNIPTFNTTEWDRTYLTFTVPANMGAAHTHLYIMANGGSGAVYADGAQLEPCAVMNRYNLLNNGSFTQNVNAAPAGWSAGSETTTGTDKVYPTSLSANRPAEVTGNTLRLYGTPNVAKEYFQQQSLMGSAGDVFVLGGWAMSKTRPFSSGGELCLEFYARPYSTGTGTPSFQTVGYAKWSEEWSDWQFAATPLVMPFRYTAIGVRIRYNNNVNYAEFAGLFLHQERFGKSYQYDSKGNVLNAENLAALKDSATYDAYNNMLTYKQPGRSEQYSLNYGATDAQRKQHLLYNATSPLDIREEYGYDDKGNTESVQVKKSNGSLFIKGEAGYANQNYAATRKDARGNTATSVTNPNAGTLTSVTDAGGQAVSYEYDTLRRTTRVKATSRGAWYENQYAYDSSDRLSEVKHNTTHNGSSAMFDGTEVKYLFDYDVEGRPTTVSVGVKDAKDGNGLTILPAAHSTVPNPCGMLSENEYNADGTLKQVRYGNGDTVENVYDGYKRLIGVKHNGTLLYTYEYGANGQVMRAYDYKYGRSYVTEYDLANRPVRRQESNGTSNLYTGKVTYDAYNRLKTFYETIGSAGESYETKYSYDAENKPTQISYDNTNQRVTYGYDELQRMSSRTVRLGSMSYATYYGYADGGYGAGSTTGMVTVINQPNETLNYGYDVCGNITTCIRNGKTTSYGYDPLGQLYRVNDENDTRGGAGGTSWKYNYDCGGNITSKTMHVYSSVETGPALATIQYGYNNPNWKDLLTSYNGQAISYDKIGNPQYDGTWTYSWTQGRKLSGMSKSGVSAVFSYNKDGIRMQKEVNGVTTVYWLHGNRVMHQWTSSNYAMQFFYDAQGKPSVMMYNGAWYGYEHNVQGDIIGIVDTAGNEVVKYTYDSWGKLLSTTGTLAGTLGYYNPFRYRGYIYDEETGLYYLRSRYYNPEWGRFLNEDVIIDTGAIFNQNLFAYCVNNPIGFYDPNGRCISCAMSEVNTNNKQEYFDMIIKNRLCEYLASYDIYKYNPNTVHAPQYDENGDLLKAGDIACAHLMKGLTKTGAITVETRYREFKGDKGRIFDKNSNMIAELKEGMEVYKYKDGSWYHVGMLIKYDLGVGEEWCVIQSASASITNCRALFHDDDGPNITSFYNINPDSDGNQYSGWTYYTDIRF